jgi:hypothetical protein
LEDDHFFYKFVDVSLRKQRVDPTAPLRGQSLAVIEGMPLLPASMANIADEFRAGVRVRTHSFHFKNYARTFVGSEAVDFLVNSSHAATRRDAVELGRQLEKDLALFHHVKREHEFKDDYVFYRFADTAGDSSVADDAQTTISSVEIEELAKVMRATIKVKNRRYHLKVYKDVFLGSEAITFLVNSGSARNREDAVQLGRRLAEVCNLFEHTERNHPLKDEQLFYRFIPEGNKLDLVKLKSIAERFEKGVQVKDNRYGFRIYKDCFIGSDAISFLVESGLAIDRKESIQIGRELAKTFNLFEHVTLEHGKSGPFCS